jgi:hypothetical protein
VEADGVTAGAAAGSARSIGCSGVRAITLVLALRLARAVAAPARRDDTECMSISAHFSVTTAAALVLGGVAASVLATVIALRGSDDHSGGGAPLSSSRPASGGSATARPATSIHGAPLEADVEYLIDASD